MERSKKGLAVEDRDIKMLASMPAAESYRRLDFDDVEVRPGFVNDTYFLIVTGTKPWLTMTVELLPLIYVQQPDYRGIEVVGKQTGIGLPTTAPYHVAIDISHLRGTKGIEVIGATRSKQVDV